MKYYVFIITALLLYSCNNSQENTQLTKEKVMASKEGDIKKEVEIKLPPSNSIKKQFKFEESKEDVWIREDSLLIVNFIESILAKNQVKFDKYLYFFGEHSEFEIETLLSKFGDLAEEKSQLMYSNPSKYNSLTLERIRYQVIDKIKKYHALKSLEFEKKNIDINFFKLKIQGVNLDEEYRILTNSSEGGSHYIIDVLNNSKSIINNQSYDTQDERRF